MFDLDALDTADQKLRDLGLSPDVALTRQQPPQAAAPQGCPFLHKGAAA